MADFIIIDGDKAFFKPNIGAAIVLKAPGVPIIEVLKGSGPATIGSKKVCIVKDVDGLKIDCVYMTPQYPIWGTGTVTLKLAANQKAKKTKSGKEKVALKGSKFTVEFKVTAGAQMPPSPPAPPPPPDQSSYPPGDGFFINTNMKVKGT